jgi:photosystem II stability/assembly factor-like uncharacterized protein
MIARRTILCLLTFLSAALVSAQSIDPKVYDALRWRCIGPFRAGRTVGASGVPGKPNVFYIGVNNGGVWKSTDYGRVWKPIFDKESTGSIGFLAVAPSKPDVVYVGTGEGLQRPDLATGDGMFKSTDGGKTWSHIGLPDAQQIPCIIVDPKNPDRVFVAVLGHPYGPNQERGIFRTLDGGKSWKKVLYKDENTGGGAVLFDPRNPKIVWADLWEARQAPWENGEFGGPGSGLYKSTDGGETWTRKTRGMPGAEQGLARIGLSIAATNPKIMLATVQANQGGGIYRSDDGGENWKLISEDRRLWGRGNDFAEIKIDPKNPDVIYIGNTACYKSVDGGKSWFCWKGAPGGDDYHTIWINPENTDVILLATDQGATITVNGGETWSSWYNQPTAQFYHVTADNQFPYSLYAGQQESGSVGIASRGSRGQITFREWQTVGANEYSYAAPDPLNPNIVYGAGVSRYHKDTGLVEVSRPPGQHRTLRTPPLLFSTVDPRVLFYGTEVLFKTKDGAKTWEQISPDLTRESYEVPDSIGVYKKPEMANLPRRGVIYAIAPSKQNIDTIWCGTDDGLIHLTNDGGKNWANVTPPQIKSWMKISQLDAGSFDNQTCYAAVDTMRIDDWRSHLYKTHDGGKTWKEIAKGIPNGEVTRTIREDPIRQGLLYCGTERSVWFSIDDGENWNPLRLNMPATSIRDLVIVQDDIAVGTHGRSFWILDDLTPLRQLAAGMGTTLFQPRDAHLVDWNRNTDTPIPPEEPAGKNPPDGAILNYYLASKAMQVTLEILDEAGTVVRRYSSEDKPAAIDPNTVPYPLYWARPSQVLGKTSGSHRFIWDMRPAPPEGGRRGLPMTAIFGDTPITPRAPMVKPGTYRVRLSIDGTPLERDIKLLPDPRSKD